MAVGALLRKGGRARLPRGRRAPETHCRVPHAGKHGPVARPVNRGRQAGAIRHRPPGIGLGHFPPFCDVGFLHDRGPARPDLIMQSNGRIFNQQ
ncbi:hypothetical protein GCM10007923_45370 [Shinella yambaruensis]|uniref:Uncharacterized protein n=1 Tax=Shinella yambaruensis TaxID=415996 RepID=A0ABQ5ZNF1_9HYPH|nr:hypothetical protein GCM10007923_45370 [Shinella yambaruensis]